MRDDDEAPSRAIVVYRSPMSYGSASKMYYVNPAYMIPNLHLFGSIGDHCILGVLGFLDGPSLVTAGRVCRSLHDLSNDNELWLSLCRTHWRVSPGQLAVNGNVKGKELYHFAQQQMQRVAQEILEVRVPTWHLPSHTVQALTRTVFGGLG